MPARKDIVERFWDKFLPEPNTGCWLWTDALQSEGYAVLSENQVPVYAHRLSYEIHKGPIPDGLHIDHLCRVRSCVNPDHLEAVTCAENIRRGPNRNREKTHCPAGHPYSDENTYINKRGDGSAFRACRICRKEQKRESQRRLRQLKKAQS